MRRPGLIAKSSIESWVGVDDGVQVIMATNRADTLDPALLRPGRLDRKIEFPLPSRREKRLIFQTVTSKMNLGPDVDLEDYVSRPDRLSSAEIASIVQAAGLQAVRKNRYVILPVDFEEAWKVRPGYLPLFAITLWFDGEENTKKSDALFLSFLPSFSLFLSRSKRSNGPTRRTSFIGSSCWLSLVPCCIIRFSVSHTSCNPPYFI
ncbi:hypothetical protein NMY22_g11485 [Coprinellus aureogranulatus]|nr:hypothetical protein NMY22_g11485 [Coprinellus aureogranulatus]